MFKFKNGTVLPGTNFELQWLPFDRWQVECHSPSIMETSWKGLGVTADLVLVMEDSTEAELGKFKYQALKPFEEQERERQSDADEEEEGEDEDSSSGGEEPPGAAHVLAMEVKALQESKSKGKRRTRDAALMRKPTKKRKTASDTSGGGNSSKSRGSGPKQPRGKKGGGKPKVFYHVSWERGNSETTRVEAK